MSGRIDPSDYLLGELSGHELAEAERRLRDDPEFRAQVERPQPLVGELRELPAEAWEGLEPPPARERAAPEPRETLRARPWAGRLSIRPALALAASLALLAGGIGIGALVAADEEPVVTSASTLDLRPVSTLAANSQGTARLDGDAGQATLELSGLPASKPSEYYELWLLSGPEELVSLGSFQVPESGEARVGVPMPADPQLFRYLDISVERLDEGPEHSGLSVLRAKT